MLLERSAGSRWPPQARRIWLGAWESRSWPNRCRERSLAFSTSRSRGGALINSVSGIPIRQRENCDPAGGDRRDSILACGGLGCGTEAACWGGAGGVAAVEDAGRQLLPDLLLDSPQRRDVLRHLLLFGGELFDAAPHGIERGCHRRKLPRRIAVSRSGDRRPRRRNRLTTCPPPEPGLSASPLFHHRRTASRAWRRHR